MKTLLTSILIGFCSVVIGQQIVGSLPKELEELSGLVFINDTTLVAHNDGGHENVLFFLNTKGEVIHTCKLYNAKNIDWEDITYDGQKFLYVGDIGNNENKRKDLCIYRVNAALALSSDSVLADPLSFRYPDQQAFPPTASDWHFDAEAITFFQDSLYIFTKCRTEPWDGLSHVYSVSISDKEPKVTHLNTMYIGKSGWWKDAVTGIDIQGDRCYMLTYNRLIIYKIRKGRLTFEKRIYLKPITQKESIAVNKKGDIYVGDERSKLLGGGYLYKVPNEGKK